MKTKLFYLLILPLLFITIQLNAQTGIKIGSNSGFHVSPNTSVYFSNAIEIQDASVLTIDATGKAFFAGAISVGTGNISVLGDIEITNSTQQTLSNFNMLVNNLTIGSGSRITVDPTKQLTVNGILTNNNATNTRLIIKSDVTGSGSLLHYTANVPATVERFIQHTAIAPAIEFHMLSSSVAAQNIAPLFNVGDFYVFNESISDWVSYNIDPTAFAAANNGTANFYPGTGYVVAYPFITTKSFAGLLNQGLVSKNLTLTAGIWSGWNLVGNPYPSSINWDIDAGFTRNTLVDADPGNPGRKAMWIWNDIIGNYGVHISNDATSNTNGVNKNIAIGQGFWVRTTINNGTFSINNSAREHSTQVFLKSSTTASEMLRLKVTGTTNNYSDEMIVRFGSTSDIGGAEKMFSIYQTAPSLYSIKNNKNWSVNYLTTVAEHPIVPVSFKAGADATYTIELEGSEWFNYVILEDLKTGIQKNMTTNNTYQFDAKTDDSPNRFLLHFAPLLGVNEVSKLEPKINYNDQKVKIENPWTGKTKAEIYNINGSLLKTFDVKQGVEYYNFNPSNGIYIIRLTNESQTFKTKIVTF